jgi:hypothetical protein
MKICQTCDKENFHNFTICERCGNPINQISHEPFSFDGFIKRNFHLYAALGILVALENYLYSPSTFHPANDFLTNPLFSIPLFIAVYLIFLLMFKALDYIFDNPQSNIRSEFSVFIFIFVHLLFLYGLMMNILNSAYIGGFCLLSGFVLVLELHSRINPEHRDITFTISLLSSVVTFFLATSLGLITKDLITFLGISDSIQITKFIIFWVYFILFLYMFALGQITATIYSWLIVGVMSSYRTNPATISILNIFNHANNENYDLEKMYALLIIVGMNLLALFIKIFVFKGS